MIPLNLTQLGSPDAGILIPLVTSEANIISTASPYEITSFFLAIVIAYIAGIFASYYLRRRYSHRVKREHLDFWIKALRIVLIVVAIAIMAPPLFDAGLTFVFWIFLVSAAVVALAGKEVIANLVAGIALMYERPFATGDFITIGETSGTVASITLFATMIRTTQGVLVHVPNDEVYTTAISNYHSNVARRFDYDVGIRYRDDVSRAVAIITEVIRDYTFALNSPAPEVFVSDLKESQVNIRIRVWFPSAWANTQDDVSLRTAILPRVKGALEAAGIEIPFPQRTLWFGNEPKSS
jgi:small-conductance mechanosensitive channel